MDPEPLVRDNAKAMLEVGRAFEEAGFHIQEVYLIKTTTLDGAVFWHLRLVTDGDPRELIYQLVRFRRDGVLPKMDEDLRVQAIRPSNIEASSILQYAHRFSRFPITIKNTPIGRLYVEYAVVAGYEKQRLAA
jgi:hypothetical protein